MQKIITGALAALTLGGAALATATPAAAQHYRGYGGYHHGGVSTGTAVGAGLLGLAVGAAVASDRGYYGRPAYGYYAPPPPPVYYAEPYYYPGYGYYYNGRYWHHHYRGRYW